MQHQDLVIVVNLLGVPIGWQLGGEHAVRWTYGQVCGDQPGAGGNAVVMAVHG